MSCEPPFSTSTRVIMLLIVMLLCLAGWLHR